MSIDRLRRFIGDMTSLAGGAWQDKDEAATIEVGAKLLAELKPGDVELLLPSEGDIHQVTNTLVDQGSISIHVYGGNIGAVRRHTFDVKTGEPKLFVSGYTNKDQPNLWDRSVEARAES